MPSADRLRTLLVAAAAALLLAACGGNSSTSECIGNCGGTEVTLTEPTGDNTTEVVVDAGPGGGFSLGVTNLPYVTVTVCAPGSSTACATIDHVFLDTGSIGLRLVRSTVESLGLPLQAAAGGSGGGVFECYPFVVGAVWGPLAQADVRIGGERAAAVPVQLIDDLSPALAAVPADCEAAAGGQMLQSVGALSAKGVLGVGMLRHDCGLTCQLGDYGAGIALYWNCGSAGCGPTALAPPLQVQNPVTFFDVNNNGTVLVMPPLPDLGAAVARGRLVFGIGTQANNQIPLSASLYTVQPDPASVDYLYLNTTVGGVRYPVSYIDSGSNGLFYDDAAITTACAGAGSGGWYCPATRADRSAQVAGANGNLGTVAFSIVSADRLFATSNVAFDNLGGAAGAANSGAFVWGMPFFYGRSVYTSVWGQALSPDGPWYAF